MVKVETVEYTLAEVKCQALVNKLSSKLAELEFDTINIEVNVYAARL